VQAPLRPTQARSLLSAFGLQADHDLGQNFLTDAQILDQIAYLGGAEVGRTVYEVGPGLGGLTAALCQRGAQVTAIELDRRLEPALRCSLEGLAVDLRWGDALDFDWRGVPAGSLFIANLPYQVATPLLAQLLRSGRFAQLTVLLQREVAERLTARPGERPYSALSALALLCGGARVLRHIPPGAFFPVPKVTSSLVQLRDPHHPGEELEAFLQLAFHHRRKTLRNALGLSGYRSGQLQAAWERLGLPAAVRAEQLSPQQLAALAGELGAPA
jgi:16S rRNA (adenine1518-N6/adenine1519-N6)-dimethyltransferase